MLVTGIAEATATATRWVVVGAIYLARSAVAPDRLQHIQKMSTQSAREGNAQSSIIIAQVTPASRTRVGFFYEKAIRGQL